MHAPGCRLRFAGANPDPRIFPKICWCSSGPFRAGTCRGLNYAARRMIMNEETLFHLASHKAPGERSAFLEKACRDDAKLRERVEVLLQAHDQPASFLESPAVPLAATVDKPAVTERPGTVI